MVRGAPARPRIVKEAMCPRHRDPRCRGIGVRQGGSEARHLRVRQRTRGRIGATERIDTVLRRFADYHDLEGAFGRRALTERAKGILMERHGIDEGEAFAMLRDHSRRTNRKIVDVAGAVAASHRLCRTRRSGAEPTSLTSSERHEPMRRERPATIVDVPTPSAFDRADGLEPPPA